MRVPSSPWEPLYSFFCFPLLMLKILQTRKQRDSTFTIYSQNVIKRFTDCKGQRNFLCVQKHCYIRSEPNIKSGQKHSRVLWIFNRRKRAAGGFIEQVSDESKSTWTWASLDQTQEIWALCCKEGNWLQLGPVYCVVVVPSLTSRWQHDNTESDWKRVTWCSGQQAFCSLCVEGD